MRSPGLLVVMIVALVIGGCSRSTGEQEPTPGQMDATSSEALVQGPADRDPAAVAGSLLLLDPCKLIVKSIAADVDFPAILGRVPTAPHACAGAQDVLMADSVTITLGTSHTHADRYSAAPITVAGAKAYRMWWGSGRCSVDIPVSFERSIHVEVKRATGARGDACPAAKAFATAAVRRLARPSKVSVDASASPLARWDGCALLSTALGADVREWQLALDSGHGADGCVATPQASDGAGDVSLALSNGVDPTTENIGSNKRVSDATVSVEEMSECFVRYSPGRSKVEVEQFAATIVELRAPTCEQAEHLTVGVQEALAVDPPELGRLNGPLTYGPDEPDSAVPGACVDFADTGCQPYQQVKPPAGADVLNAVAANPDALCAVAVGPVREILGEEFQPVTYGEFCAFVEPTHRLTVFLSALPDEAPANYGANPELYEDRQTIDVAGHPAVAFTSGDPQSAVDHSVYASTGSDIAAKGFVSAEFSFRPPRGDFEAVAEPVGTERLAALLSQIIAEHFDA